MILLTHAHGDHSGGALALRGATGPRSTPARVMPRCYRPESRERRFSAPTTCRATKLTRPLLTSASQEARQ